MILVRVHSHRARRKLRAALGERLGREYFSFYRPGEFYYVNEADADEAIGITGVSRARDTGNLQPCMTI